MRTALTTAIRMPSHLRESNRPAGVRGKLHDWEVVLGAGAIYSKI